MPSTTGSESETQPDSHQGKHRNAGRALTVGVVTLMLVYGWLFYSGSRFVVMKTAVMPIFVLYAVMLRRRTAFLTDWLPLLAGTVLFDALRGAIFVAIRGQHLPIFPTYTIALERLIFRTPASPLVLQQWQRGWLDALAVAIHASHFAFFLLFGLVLWHLQPAQFGRFRRTLLLVMAFGLIGYLCVPSVPPWLAFQEFHLLPPVVHIVSQMYTTSFGELYGTFDTNPVAAMPSLHAAFPAACALVGLSAYGTRVGIALGAYALAVMLAIIYLGEHYAVDVVAGVAVALVAARVGRHRWAGSLSVLESLAISTALLALTLVILLTYR